MAEETGPGTPENLDGLWLLDGTDLSLSIDLDTASVDARTNCARLLGSLTFEQDGQRASFSLPGREDQSCTEAQRNAVDLLQDDLESVASVQADPGRFELLDSNGEPLGTLQTGG